MLKGVTFLIRNSWTAFLGRCIINKDFLGRNFQGDEGLEETFETEKQACTKAWKLASIMYFQEIASCGAELCACVCVCVCVCVGLTRKVKKERGQIVTKV